MSQNEIETETTTTIETETMTQTQTQTKTKHRCHVCNKKVGLLGFECKCTPDAVFCSVHRYFYEHGCTLNVHEAYKDTLRKQNVVVKAAKLQTVL